MMKVRPIEQAKEASIFSSVLERNGGESEGDFGDGFLVEWALDSHLSHLI